MVARDTPQIDALKAAGCERIYSEKAFGAQVEAGALALTVHRMGSSEYRGAIQCK